jgi:hypothetical protein
VNERGGGEKVLRVSRGEEKSFAHGIFIFTLPTPFPQYINKEHSLNAHHPAETTSQQFSVAAPVVTCGYNQSVVTLDPGNDLLPSMVSL